MLFRAFLVEGLANSVYLDRDDLCTSSMFHFLCDNTYRTPLAYFYTSLFVCEFPSISILELFLPPGFTKVIRRNIDQGVGAQSFQFSSLYSHTLSLSSFIHIPPPQHPPIHRLLSLNPRNNASHSPFPVSFFDHKTL